MKKWTVERLVGESGWKTPTNDERAQMLKAINWFQDTVPKVLGGLPWLLSPIPANEVGFYNAPTGKGVRLAQFMQAIAFTAPVIPNRKVEAGRVLLQRRRPASVPNGEPGRYFADPTKAGAGLALPADQRVRRLWRAKQEFTCLESTAADNFTDWILPKNAKNPETTNLYRHGGGTQFFVWLPKEHLQPL